MVKDLKTLIEKTARLARLEFAADELEKIAAKAKTVISYVEQLNELDTDGVLPTSHAVDTRSGLRDDRVAESKLALAVLNAAPKRDGGFVQVPKVIDSEE